MPLNMNTLIGGGPSSGSSTGDISILSRDVSEIPMNQCPAYYVDYNEVIPDKTDTFKILKEETGEYPFVQIFTFKGYTYGVSTNTYNGSSSSYSTAMYTVRVNRINILNSTFSTQSTLMFSSYYTTAPRTYVLVGKEYIYYIRMILNEEFTYNGATGTATNAYLCRWDGTTEERLRPLWISNTKHPQYGNDIMNDAGCKYSTDIPCFTWLDFEKEIILLGYGGKCIRIYTNPFKVAAYNPSSTIVGDLTRFTFTYTIGSSAGYAKFQGVALLKNKGYVITESDDFVEFDFNNNDGTIFTVENAVARHKYWKNGMRINMSEPNMYTCCATYYPSGARTRYISPPIVMFYNYKTNQAEVHERSWRSTDKLNGYQSVKYGDTSVIAHIDRLRDRIIYASCYEDSSSKSRSIAIQPCTPKYVVGYDNTSNSTLTAYFHKGDKVYCSKTITDYDYNESGSYTSISRSSRVFVIPNDGTYKLRCVHGDGSYIPSWVAIDNNSNLIYLKYYKISSTQIHGWFIGNMQVNGYTTTDGEQTLTLSDFSKTGITINMKGVK